MSDSEIFSGFLRDETDELIDERDTLRQQRDLLIKSWELPQDAVIVDAGPNWLLVDGWSGSRRRISMACPKELDTLRQQLDASEAARIKAEEVYAKMREDMKELESCECSRCVATRKSRENWRFAD